MRPKASNSSDLKVPDRPASSAPTVQQNRKVPQLSWASQRYVSLRGEQSRWLARGHRPDPQSEGRSAQGEDGGEPHPSIGMLVGRLEAGRHLTRIDLQSRSHIPDDGRRHTRD